MAPRIVIALADDIASQLAEKREYDGLSLLRIATRFEEEQHRLGRLRKVLQEYAAIETRLLVEAGNSNSRIRRTLLSEVQSEAELRRLKPDVRIPTMLGFFVFDNAHLDQPSAERLLGQLRELRQPDPESHKPDLKTAYFEQRVTSASGGKSHRYEYVRKQGYLTGAGINLLQPASLAPPPSSFDGKNVQFIDIEKGWNVDHEAFDAAVRACNPGVLNDDSAVAHGNAVLGIVLARGSKSRIRGIAQGCTLKDLYALNQEPGDTWDEQVGHAILAARDNLNAGDIVLIPLQSDAKLPVEASPFVFDAIQQAHAKDIIIIEAAGNMNDRLERYSGNETMAPGWADRRGVVPAWPDKEARNGVPDSGAIIVGGCVLGDPGKPPSQDQDTCRGARVDCCAWSQDVYTSYSHTTTGYDTFIGTSAASPIIAGVALVTQDCAKNKLRRHLTPAEMRDLLRDPTFGTVVKPAGESPISMPDASKLFQQVGSGMH